MRKDDKLFCIFLLVLCLLPITGAAQAQNSPGTQYPSQQLQPSNLIYQGAFRLPDNFNWGALGVSFYPKGSGDGTLLVTGFQSPSDPDHPGEACWDPSWNCAAFYGQVTIPSPKILSDWESLPEATIVGGMINFDNSLVAGVEREYSFVSDLEYVPLKGSQTADKIYGAINVWYAEGVFGDDSFPTIWLADMDGSNARGVFHVGPDSPPFHGRKTGAYMFTVPRWYSDQYLGGRRLVTGRSRGTPAGLDDVTTQGGSQGPTLFAFHTFASDDPSGDLDALPMLYYRVKFPGCAGPNIGPTGDCDFTGYTLCDDWTGAAFVDNGSQRAVMILGHKGLGSNCYDTPPVTCNDPCSDSKGYHCYPYERQVLFYDVQALGAAAQGLAKAWEVLPYTVWQPQEFYLQGAPCHSAGGMTVDPRSGRVFMVERGLGGDTNAAVVHVWQVSPFAQEQTADVLFNWLESEYSQLIPSGHQPTQESAGIYFRYYADIDSYVGIIGDELHLLDYQGTLHSLGLVGLWLDQLW